ncbi:MAG: DUF6457 domain-containing protein [Candidatus Dormibacteraceae bacterium]
MNAFFERYAGLLAEECAAVGHPIAEPELDADLSRALLDLTRAVAHTQERRFGPLAAYLTGVALERARAGGAALDAAAATALVDRVVERLEADSADQ